METKLYYDSNPKRKDLSLENKTGLLFPNAKCKCFPLRTPPLLRTIKTSSDADYVLK